MTSISARLRRLVIERAEGFCEYCRIHQDDSFFSFEVDHIIAEKHGGESTAENLALSCADCNAYKGSDIGSVDPQTGKLTPLFNPREQHWSDHFALSGAAIEALTGEGRVTLRLLKLNQPHRLEQRTTMIQLGLYPPEARQPQ